MSINTMNDLYEQALHTVLSNAQKVSTSREDWADFEGCRTVYDVRHVLEDTLEIEFAYDNFEEYMYDIVRVNHGAVWRLLESELTEAQMIEVADEYEYEDIDDSEQFMFELIREYYLNSANTTKSWHYLFNADYLDFVVENLKRMGIL